MRYIQNSDIFWNYCIMCEVWKNKILNALTLSKKKSKKKEKKLLFYL